MANSLVQMYRIKDLRKKIFITLGLLIVSRIGAVIPIPGIDPEVLKLFFLSQSSSSNIGLTEYLNFFSGGAFSNFSLFMLGVMPYISTPIIVQLLMLVIPSLKKLAQDPSGHKKIQQYTRYGTIVVCLIQSYVVTIYANSIPGVMTMGVLPFTLVAMLTVTTGSMLLIWIGNKITQWGIGNGISLLIFAGIVARFPEAMSVLFRSISAGVLNPIVVLVVFVMFLVVVALVVYEEQGVRKIPVNYAKRVVGRKMYGAQSTYIPIKVNPSGVIPVIFAAHCSLSVADRYYLGPGNKVACRLCQLAESAGCPLSDYLRPVDHSVCFLLYAGVYEPGRDGQADSREWWLGSRCTVREIGRVPDKGSQPHRSSRLHFLGFHRLDSHAGTEVLQLPLDGGHALRWNVIADSRRR